MDFIFPISIIKTLLPILAIIAGIFVITTKNPIISVFNLIVLYILVAFYLIFIGLTYLGISYIVVYIGAIAILFLFVIMIIDIEVVEKRSNNYLLLLFLLLGGFLYTLKNNFYHLGLVKMKSLSFRKDYIYNNKNNVEQLFNIRNDSNLTLDSYNVKEVFNNNLIVNNNNSNNCNKDLFNIDFYFYNENNIQKSMFNFINNELIYNDVNSEIGINYLSNNSVKYTIFNILSNDIWELNPISTSVDEENINYSLIITDWDSIINKITQVSTIGDVLYTLYHSYIYILSVILLLGLIGAIILTVDTFQEAKTINTYKISSFLIIFYPLKKLFRINKLIRIIRFYYNVYCFKIKEKNKRNFLIIKSSIPMFPEIINLSNWHSEVLIGSLSYYIIISIVVALLLLFINSYFSLNVKYLEKGGGFECGFTSFLQTRERFNIIFYRVSLLFLVFDLEIILIYPYPAIYQKSQNISKNNVLIFIYILVIGFVYELKEGALNIVKKGRSTEINNN